jgi:hypothetical protein
LRRCRHCDALLKIVYLPGRGPVTVHAVVGRRARCEQMREMPSGPSASASPGRGEERAMNRWGEVVRLDAKGNCTDCGYPPAKCMGDEHR